MRVTSNDRLLLTVGIAMLIVAAASAGYCRWRPDYEIGAAYAAGAAVFFGFMGVVVLTYGLACLRLSLEIDHGMIHYQGFLLASEVPLDRIVAVRELWPGISRTNHADLLFCDDSGAESRLRVGQYLTHFTSADMALFLKELKRLKPGLTVDPAVAGRLRLE